MRENQNFAVIGLGAFGSTIALELARFGNQVIGIDRNEQSVSRMAEQLPATAILDTTDEVALREAGLDRYQCAVVAIGDDLQSSILTTMNLKLLGIGKIWVKASNKTHHRILSKLGADRVILPEQEMGRHIAQMLNTPLVQNYMSLGNGHSVVHMAVSDRLEGTQIADLALGAWPSLRLLGLMRGTEFRDCATGTILTLQKEDRLIMLGKRADLRAFGDAL